MLGNIVMFHIIGGGIIGCTIAYYASKYVRDVLIFEKGEFVSGTMSI